jgi:hypothetical protein
MLFHIEIGSPVDFARALNVDEESLRNAILEPWVGGLPVLLGGRSWEPGESRLTVLQGPALPAPTDDDEGWATAQRTADDVTRPLLEAAEAGAFAQTAAVVEADSVEEALRLLRAGHSPRQVPWVGAVERVESRDSEVAAMILVVTRSASTRPRL